MSPRDFGDKQDYLSNDLWNSGWLAMSWLRLGAPPQPMRRICTWSQLPPKSPMLASWHFSAPPWTVGPVKCRFGSQAHVYLLRENHSQACPVKWKSKRKVRFFSWWWPHSASSRSCTGLSAARYDDGRMGDLRGCRTFYPWISVCTECCLPVFTQSHFKWFSTKTQQWEISQTQRDVEDGHPKQIIIIH